MKKIFILLALAFFSVSAYAQPVLQEMWVNPTGPMMYPWNAGQASRDATIIGGNMYVIQNVNPGIVRIIDLEFGDETGQINLPGPVGFGITSDCAGNLIIPNNTGGTWVPGNVTKVNVASGEIAVIAGNFENTTPTATRIDFPAARGNFGSATETGWLLGLSASNANDNLIAWEVKDGARTDRTKIRTSTGGWTGQSVTWINDNTVLATGFNRPTPQIMTLDFSDGTPLVTNIQNIGSSLRNTGGGTVFTLGGIQYAVLPVVTQADARSGAIDVWDITNPATPVLITSKPRISNLGDGGVARISIKSVNVSDTEVQIFVWSVNNGGAGYRAVAANGAFSVPAGNVGIGSTLALTSTTAGAVINYTLDGSTPTASSPVFDPANPITFNTEGEVVVRMLVTAPGLFPNLMSATYEVIPPTYYTVSFNANGGAPTPDPQQVIEGGLVTRPADPVLAHNKLTEWVIPMRRSHTLVANIRSVAGDATAATVVAQLRANTPVYVVGTTMVGATLWYQITADLNFDNTVFFGAAGGGTGSADGSGNPGVYTAWMSSTVLTVLESSPIIWNFDSDVVTGDVLLQAQWRDVRQANIFASELSVSAIDASNSVTFTYTLNADASAVTITVLNGAGGTAGDVFVSTGLSKGVNSFTGTLTNLADGCFSWTVEAVGVAENTVVGAVPVKFTDDLNPLMQFNSPRGLVMDRNMDSPFFGRLYIGESFGAAMVGGRTTTDGIYVLNAALEDVTGQGAAAWTGGVDWVLNAGSADWSPYRLSVDALGHVYIVQYFGADHNVWIMDPANPAADFVAAFGPGANQNRAIQAQVFGDNLYLLSTTANPFDAFGVTFQTFNNFEPGRTTPADHTYAFTGSEIIVATSSFVPDGKGGFWFAQNRAGENEATLMHRNAAGTRTLDLRRAVVGQIEGGALAYCPERNLLVLGTQNNVRVYEVSWNDGVPTLSATFVSIPIGGQIANGVAIDPAGNIFIASLSTRRLTGWALPNSVAADNTFTTTAPISQQIVIGAGCTPFTVTFDADGGAPTPDPQQVLAGGLVTKPADPTKTGYDFVGWFDSNPVYVVSAVAGLNRRESPGTGAIITGQGIPFGTQFVVTEIVTIANANPVWGKTSYGGVTGWVALTEPNLVNFVASGSKWDFYLDVVTEDITLTAHWTTSKFTVTFYAEGGTPTPAPQEVAYGGLVTEPTAPTKDGFDFAGWFHDGTLWVFATNTVTSDISLIAQWTPTVGIPTTLNGMIDVYAERNGNIHINVTGTTLQSYNVFGVDGRLLQSNNATSNSVEINASNLGTGVLLIQVNTEAGTLTRRVIR